jgi:hypothetical protein
MLLSAGGTGSAVSDFLIGGPWCILTSPLHYVKLVQDKLVLCSREYIYYTSSEVCLLVRLVYLCLTLTCLCTGDFTVQT